MARDIPASPASGSEMDGEIEPRGLLDLPQLCLDLVAERLTPRSAASVASVSRGAYDQLALPAFEAIDPGSVEELRTRVAKFAEDAAALAERIRGGAPETPSVSTTMTVASIKAACKAIGAPTTGNKQTLVEGFAACVAEREATRLDDAAAIEGVLASSRDAATRLSRTTVLVCPVRPNVRILATCDGKAATTLVTATTAKELGASEAQLSRLVCQLRRNPHGRNAPPMRLYVRSEVLRAVVLGRGGPGQLGDAAVPDLAAAAEEAIALAAGRRKTLRLNAKWDADARRMVAELTRDTMTLEELAGDRLGGSKAVSAVLGGRCTRAEFADAVVAACGRAERRRTLATALESLGLELRGDSRLCEAYVRSGVGDVDSIVVVMREMEFYFQHTEYARILQRLHDDMHSRRRRDKRYERYDRDYESSEGESDGSWVDAGELSEDAKMTALQRYFGGGGTTMREKLGAPCVPDSIRARWMGVAIQAAVESYVSAALKPPPASSGSEWRSVLVDGSARTDLRVKLTAAVRTLRIPPYPEWLFDALGDPVKFADGVAAKAAPILERARVFYASVDLVTRCLLSAGLRAQSTYMVPSERAALLRVAAAAGSKEAAEEALRVPIARIRRIRELVDEHLATMPMSPNVRSSVAKRNKVIEWATSAEGCTDDALRETISRFSGKGVVCNLCVAPPSGIFSAAEFSEHLRIKHPGFSLCNLCTGPTKSMRVFALAGLAQHKRDVHSID